MTMLTAVADLLGLSSNTLLVAVAMAAVGMAAGVVGCFSVLRRRALIGDAAAHATLPGVALAFVITGSRGLPVLLIGAAVSAVASMGLLVLLRRFTRTRDDAATAVPDQRDPHRDQARPGSLSRPTGGRARRVRLPAQRAEAARHGPQPAPLVRTRRGDGTGIAHAAWRGDGEDRERCW